MIGIGRLCVGSHTDHRDTKAAKYPEFVRQPAKDLCRSAYVWWSYEKHVTPLPTCSHNNRRQYQTLNSLAVRELCCQLSIVTRNAPIYFSGTRQSFWDYTDFVCFLPETFALTFMPLKCAELMICRALLSAGRERYKPDASPC